MTDVRMAIRREISSQGSKGPAPRDILSVNASGTTLKDPILDFTGKSLTCVKGQNRFKNIIEIETFDVGKSCDDVLKSQNASQSGLYLIHPPNLVQGPWKVYCDQESNGGGWTV